MVVTAGAELFTGNNLVMFTGLVKGTVKFGDALLLWIICWLGNAAGGILLAFLYHLTGLGNGAVGDFMAESALTKMTLSPAAMITRGILCNMLVCLAVWCGFRLKTEAGKLIMVFWCLLAFITTGFEHSVANMYFIPAGMLTSALYGISGEGLSLFGFFITNLIPVTIGNIIGGGICVGAMYYAIYLKKQ